MISKVSECQRCYSKEICVLSAISLESDIKLKSPAGQFNAFYEIENKTSNEIKAYFKKFVECITLEQSEERQSMLKP